ncbi:MAG: hypothetical protein JO242_17620 [Streptosporangiaceae bacterium]|nr:hypothetical protein [Streptosporangiaceae bacterium]
MKKLRIRILVIPAMALMAVLGALGPASAAPAHGIQAASAASPPTEICAATTACFNAWSGGPWIKTYAAGAGNDYFYVQQLTRMCNNGVSTSSCPLSGNLNIPGLFIYQIRYGNEYAGGYDNCLADDGAKDGQTAFGYCQDVNGTGGSYGTIYLAYPAGCPSGSNVGISREWTDYYGAYYGISFQAGNGNPVYDKWNSQTSPGLACLYQNGTSPSRSRVPVSPSSAHLPQVSVPGTRLRQP